MAMALAQTPERLSPDDPWSHALLLAQDGGAVLEDLVQFRRWSIFLPRAASTEREKNAVYVRSRQAGNPKFFEQMRDRLSAVLHDCRLLQAAGAEFCSTSSVPQALELLLQSQWVALGYLSIGQLYKALTLCEIGEKVADAVCGSQQGLVFWRVLTRTNLGYAYARTRRFDEARSVLRRGIRLVEANAGAHAAPSGVASPGAVSTDGSELTSMAVAHAVAGAAAQVLLGACYSHLNRVELEAGDMEAAVSFADLEIEAFERFIMEPAQTLEDQEAAAAVLATSYSLRGSCDEFQERYDSALAWYARSIEILEKHADVDPDREQILARVQGDIERVRLLQS